MTQPMASQAQYQQIVERDRAIEELNRAKDGVTVCVPCFEQSEYLEQCLDSVATQTVPVFETLVIDDGSDPEEGLRIRTICESYKNTRCVRTTNRKLPGARNTALMLTRSYAFLPLDADDWIEPTYVEEMLPLLRDADVVVPGLQEHGPTRNGTFMPGYDRPLDQVTLDVMWEFNRTFYASLFRTQLLREVGGYNGLMVHGFEDYDLAIDLMGRGARYVGVNKVLFHYRTRPDGMLTDAMTKQHMIMEEMRRHHRR